MFGLLKKATLATTLAATVLVSATPAMARDYNYGGNGGYRSHDRGDTTGAAIIGGIFGIAIGAMIASGGNHNRDRDRYRDRGWEYRGGYYWDRQGHRYDRNGRQCDEGYGDNGGYYRGNDHYRGNDGYGYRGNEGYRNNDGYRGGYRGW